MLHNAALCAHIHQLILSAPEFMDKMLLGVKALLKEVTGFVIFTF